MRRRRFLSLPVIAGLGGVVAAAGGTLAGCGGPGGGEVREPDRAGEGRSSYGSDPSQFGDLYLPEGTPTGVVVVIHGGFWLSQYDYTLGQPLATSLSERGWAAWNLEYRRVGNGGGDPQTMDDVAAGIDKLADLDLGVDLDAGPVVTLGHSAGGQLAAFAASRGRSDAWSPAQVGVTHVISQAGVLDLVGGAEEDLGGGAVQAFLGHEPGPDDAPVDPLQQVPLDVPVWCVHARDDGNVPYSQSQTYVAAAQDAGADAELVEVTGGHFGHIDTNSSAWARTLEIFDTIAPDR